MIPQYAMMALYYLILYRDMPQITIYTTPTCGYCKMAKEYFTSLGLEYGELNVFEDEKAREDMISKSQQMGVPVIVIDDGEAIVGFDKPKIDKALESGGAELKPAA
jgi:glutaredoxin-like YruB-family protein